MAGVEVTVDDPPTLSPHPSPFSTTHNASSIFSPLALSATTVAPTSQPVSFLSPHVPPTTPAPPSPTHLPFTYVPPHLPSKAIPLHSFLHPHTPTPPTRIDPTFSPCISPPLFTGLKSPPLLPLIVPQSSPSLPPIPPPPAELPPDVPPSCAIPPTAPITPLVSPLPILGSRFWLLAGSKGKILAVAFGSISAAIADVLTVGVVSSFYPLMGVFVSQEVQLCGFQLGLLSSTWWA
ncbi:extensin-like [Salvia miltiorrhiza]|uniref:extensin-like n=1 Tax=Salvia miltiorrhiza TaxID=226208 RepID=UPI0025AC5E3B|nr:extensin-like [Salvia miltiorrhiza]